MLKKAAGDVFASLRGSTYRNVRLSPSLVAALPAERRVLARRGWAGEKEGLFEHPVGWRIRSVNFERSRGGAWQD